MPYNYASNIWDNTIEHFYKDRNLLPIVQCGPHCVSTSLAIITSARPEDFQNKELNTQDPDTWSSALKSFGMKLAYCPTDVRKLVFYMEELIAIDDLFLLCYYSPTGTEILNDPDSMGWICGSHVVVLHRNKIIDPLFGGITAAREHECNGHHTKRIFRVVPENHSRGL